MLQHFHWFLLEYISFLWHSDVYCTITDHITQQLLYIIAAVIISASAAMLYDESTSIDTDHTS